MPTVTKLSAQKKNRQRLNVFLDGQFSFGINLETALEAGLEKGKSINQTLIDKLLKKEKHSKLFDKSLRFLEFRPRSEKEVRDYLAKKIAASEGIKFFEARESTLVEKVIAKLKKYKYLNDLEFAAWLLGARTRTRPKSKLAVKIELMQKGIEKETIEKVLANFPNEVELAKIAVEKKVNRWKSLGEVEFRKKLQAYLLNRGFSYDIVKKTFAFFTSSS